MNRSFWCTALLLVWGAPLAASGQVPRFDSAPPRLPLDELRSLSPQVRLAAIAKLAKARQNGGAVTALSNLLLQDPKAAVRQAAAVALAKVGGKAGKRMLAYAAVCDPDPATRKGLAAYARRASISCHEHTHPRATGTAMPTDAARLVAYLAHPLSDVRLRALRTLARMRATAAYRVMWDQATKDPFWAVRVDALRAIAPRYRAKMGPLVTFSVTSDPDARVRAVGLELLAYLRMPSAVRLAATSARGETAVKTRDKALQTLVKIGDRFAVQELAILATSHPGEDTRLAAIGALLSINRHRSYAQKVLARVLSQDRSGKVRAAAMRSLSGSRDRAACSAFAQRINDPEAEVRRTVVDRLSVCPAGVALPALHSAAREDKDASVRKAALKLLTRTPPTQADTRAVLTAVLQRDREPANRRICLEALLSLTPKDQAEVLIEVARTDADGDLRAMAVESLAKQPARISVPALSGVLQRDSLVPVRLAAVKALGRYSDETAYDALRAAATADAAEVVRKAAAASAGKSPAQRAWVNGMLSRTLDPSAAVRLKAATELCALRVPRTFRALVRLLWVDKDASVRTAVARCFSDLDSPLIDVALSVAHGIDKDGGVVRTIEIAQRQRVQRVTALLQQAQGANADQRRQAVQALVPGANSKLRQVLEHLLVKDPDQAVRHAAASKLYRFADQRAIQKLMLASQSEQHPATRAFVLGLYDDLRRRWGSAKTAYNLTTLTHQLENGSGTARVRAALALGTLRDRRAFQSLQTAAAASDPELRYAAILALATYGDVGMLSKAARAEQDKGVRDRLIQVNFLRTGPEERLIGALESQDANEVQRAVEAAAIRRPKQGMPHLARLALSHLQKKVRRGAARALVLYDSTLAYWTIRVGSSHDASKKLRSTLWGLAVMADPGNS